VFGILGPLILAQSHEYDNKNNGKDVKEQRK
jgi:hypothetical protein